MSKPTWDEAPEWAAWLAMDFDGVWYWYEYEPRMRNREWDSGLGLVQRAEEELPPWRDTLEPRP